MDNIWQSKDLSRRDNNQPYHHPTVASGGSKNNTSSHGYRQRKHENKKEKRVYGHYLSFSVNNEPRNRLSILNAFTSTVAHQSDVDTLGKSFLCRTLSQVHTHSFMF